MAVIADKIHSELPEADISDVMDEVEALLDKSVAAQPYVIRDKGEPYDLSKIDFDQLRAHFAEGHKRTEAEKLRGAIHARLLQMVRLNKSRMDYLDEYQRMIDEYNAARATSKRSSMTCWHSWTSSTPRSGVTSPSN